MRSLSIQIPRWLLNPEVWRILGFVSTIVGLLFYALSSSFKHLFGNWNFTKLFVYIVLCVIISLATLFAKVWQHSPSLRFRAHVVFLVLTITSVYSFFFDKAVNGKPDTYSLVSCVAFALMSLSLSRQIHCGFEVDLLYFFLGALIVQLMKINEFLGIVGVCFSYVLVVLRSSLDLALGNGILELQDQNHVVIQMDSQQHNTDDELLIMAQFMDCIAALRQRNSALIHTVLEHVKEYSEGFDDSGLVINRNLVLYAVPSQIIYELQEAAKSTIAAGLEKNFADEYSDCRRECLKECLSRLLKLESFGMEDSRTLPDQSYIIGRWIKASNVAMKILFPSERRLCDRVFFGLSSGVVDPCFIEICREEATQLLNFANGFANGSHPLYPTLRILETLSDLIPKFKSLFGDDLNVCLVKEAVTAEKRLSEAIAGSYAKMRNLTFHNKVANKAELVLPNGMVHPITRRAMEFILLSCRSRKNLEPILQEYLKGTDGASTWSSFPLDMVSLLELLERKLEINSNNFEDPALQYIFMINNRRYIKKIVREWNLGPHLSHDWVQNNTQKIQQNLELYYRNSSWNKVLEYLKLEKESLTPNVAAESMKERLNLFTMHFNEVCSVQSRWFVLDDQLREEIITHIEKMVLPAYGNFIGKFREILAASANEYIKYEMVDIEARLKDLFRFWRKYNETVVNMDVKLARWNW